MASIPGAEPEPSEPKSDPPRNSKGWDGKLRLDSNKEPILPEAPTPPDSDDEDVERPVEHVEGEQIDADEGKTGNDSGSLDLLDGFGEDETEIDLNHNRISSIPALRLERFKQLQYLCLRQNQLTSIHFPEDWASAKTLKDVDFYDNNIAHIKNLEDLLELTNLDLSFNVIKHIKRVNHLKKLRDLFFVQNKISQIEGLEGLTELRNLELGGNRIRDIENLETLQNLEELYLGKNKITELKKLDCLSNLKILSIQSNRITSPSLSHLAKLSQLTDVYISHNLLDSLEPLSSVTNLRILDVSNNPISSLRGLEALTHIEELWASNCKLDSFEEIGKILGDKEHLDTVYFEGNPLETRQRALYRNKVKLALPQVRQVDATLIRTD